MTDLSPQAQAVLNAFGIPSDGHYDDGVWVPHIREQLASALEAAADQVVPKEQAPKMMHLLEPERLAQRPMTRAELLAIAAELRGQEGSND
jgi:hypothetical protein